MKKIMSKIIDYVKNKGWKAALAIFLFYLVRDVSLYIILPWLVVKNIIIF